MLEHTAFSLADDGVLQTVALVGFGIADIVFFIWVAYLIRQ
jgi:hypothetical protein